MASKYFAGLSSSSSTSSRKGKKINGSDKPKKQPQRGLGVAQLEKIRLHTQLGCANYLPTAHNPDASNCIQEDVTAAHSPSSSSFSYSSTCSPPYGHGFQGHHGLMTGLQDLDIYRAANITYGDSQSSNVARWHQGSVGFGTQHFVDPSMATSFFQPDVIQGCLNNKNKNKKELMDLMGSRSRHNSESSGSQEIDLELKLSL